MLSAAALRPDEQEQLAAPWREAAARLAHSLDSAAGEELRLALLKRLNRRFGDHGYPGFLKLLLIVAESDAHEAQRQLAEAITLGLRRGDAPSGVLTSWGATRFWETSQPLQAGMLPGNVMGMAPRRQLDPLEYLTVWFCQRTHRPYLGDNAYRHSVASLVALFNLSPAARTLYPLKIEADLAGVEGAFTRQTRQRLETLAAAWKQGLAPQDIAAAAADTAAPAPRWQMRDL